MTRLHSLHAGYANLEVFLAEEVDFVFAGWSYGMRVGGEVTPESLGTFGIPVYELTESCIRIGQREKASLDFLYRDLTNLASVFDVAPRAAVLIAQYRRRIDAVEAAVSARTTAPSSVFVYDSGERLAQTAGGENIVAEVESSWVRVAWETVVDRNPDAVLIVDYGEVTPGPRNIGAVEKVAAFLADIADGRR